jgi:hypothetical protein
MEVGAQRDKFRVLREHALALVRDYNKVRGGAPDARLRCWLALLLHAGCSSSSGAAALALVLTGLTAARPANPTAGLCSSTCPPLLTRARMHTLTPRRC